MSLTPNTHHLVREALMGATITDVVHWIGLDPDRLELMLDDGQIVIIEAVDSERIDLRFASRTITTPFDDPIVQACVDHGGHFWPDDAPEDEPVTCTRCWFNPGWRAGRPRDETDLRPVRDDPAA